MNILAVAILNIAAAQWIEYQELLNPIIIISTERLSNDKISKNIQNFTSLFTDSDIVCLYRVQCLLKTFIYKV